MLYFIDLGKVANFIILLLQTQKTISAVLSFFLSFLQMFYSFIFIPNFAHRQQHALALPDGTAAAQEANQN